MWKKYKFEWKFLSSAVAGVIQQTGGKSVNLSGNFKRLRGQRRKAKDDAKKAEKKK